MDGEVVLRWKMESPGSRFDSDSGSGARDDISVFHVRGSELWYPVCLVGDSCSSTSKTCLLVSPVEEWTLKYHRHVDTVWTDAGSGKSSDYRIFRFSAPPGYCSLGDAFAKDTSSDSSLWRTFVSVHENLCVPASIGSRLWCDAGTGARQDGSLWEIVCPSRGINANGMVGSGNHSTPNREVFTLARGPVVNPNAAERKLKKELEEAEAQRKKLEAAAEAQRKEQERQRRVEAEQRRELEKKLRDLEEAAEVQRKKLEAAAEAHRMELLARQKKAEEEQDRELEKIRIQMQTELALERRKQADLIAEMRQMDDPRAVRELRERVVNNAANLAVKIAKADKFEECTLGIFGIQSSGKSSLLNALFSLQLKTGKGKTTKVAEIVATTKSGIKIMDVFGSSDDDMYETFETVSKIAKLHIALICTATGYQSVKNITKICTKEGVGIKTILVTTMCDQKGNQEECELHDENKAFADEQKCAGSIMVSAKEPPANYYNINALRQMIEDCNPNKCALALPSAGPASGGGF